MYRSCRMYGFHDSDWVHFVFVWIEIENTFSRKLQCVGSPSHQRHFLYTLTNKMLLAMAGNENCLYLFILWYRKNSSTVRPCLVGFLLYVHPFIREMWRCEISFVWWHYERTVQDTSALRVLMHFAQQIPNIQISECHSRFFFWSRIDFEENSRPKHQANRITFVRMINI